MLQGEDAKTYGANRWDVAEFSREQDKAKFMSLLVSSSVRVSSSAVVVSTCIVQVNAPCRA